jgi:molybdopterin biosynthesis enzyme
MAEADSLIVVPAAAESLADGAEVAVLLLDCFAG